MAFAQAAENTSSSPVALLATSAKDFSACNFLAMLVVIPTTITVSSIQDSTGTNTWASDPDGVPKVLSGTASQGYVYTVTNPAVSATQTFQANFTGGTDIAAIFVVGLSGRATVSPILAHNYAPDSGSVTSHTGGATGALGQSGCDLLGFLFDDEGTGGGRALSYTAGSGWTLPSTMSNSDGRAGMTGGIEYQNNVGTGGATVTWTSSGANTGGAYILAIKPASVNTTVTPGAGSDTITGNQPTVTPATNTVVQTFTARHGSGVLEPDRRVIMPRDKKIFLPLRRAA